jgi:hypothetical protein
VTGRLRCLGQGAADSPPKPPPHKFEPLVLPDNCEEAAVQEWFKYGLGELCQFIRHYYRFADYLDAHPSDDPALD